jgi:hypothetical protein
MTRPNRDSAMDEQVAVLNKVVLMLDVGASRRRKRDGFVHATLVRLAAGNSASRSMLRLTSNVSGKTTEKLFPTDAATMAR